MKLHELKAPAGSTKNRKRRGRGTGTGQGKTGGRGMNGQNSRSGGGVRLGFEGGQMPLYRRLPKRGFNNKWAKEYAEVNVKDLNRFEQGTEVTPEVLREAGLVKQVVDGIKILGHGDLEKALTVKAQKFTKTAEEKINEWICLRRFPRPLGFLRCVRRSYSPFSCCSSLESDQVFRFPGSTEKPLLQFSAERQDCSICSTCSPVDPSATSRSSRYLLHLT